MILEAHPSVKTLYQPFFSYSFKNEIKTVEQSTYQDLVARLLATDDPFCCRRNEFHRGSSEGGDPSLVTKGQTTHLVLKNVHHHQYLEKMLRLDPELRILALIRHPCATIHSQLIAEREKISDWKTAPNKNATEDDFFGFDKWSEFNSMTKHLSEKYPERVFLVRYEDLVMDPNQWLREICRFVALPFDDCLLEACRRMGSCHQNYDYSVFRQGDTVNRWKGQLCQDVVNRITDEMYRLLTNGPQAEKLWDVPPPPG
jgi:hypothetical protein